MKNSMFDWLRRLFGGSEKNDPQDDVQPVLRDYLRASGHLSEADEENINILEDLSEMDDRQWVLERLDKVKGTQGIFGALAFWRYPAANAARDELSAKLADVPTERVGLAVKGDAEATARAHRADIGKRLNVIAQKHSDVLHAEEGALNFNTILRKGNFIASGESQAEDILEAVCTAQAVWFTEKLARALDNNDTKSLVYYTSDVVRGPLHEELDGDEGLSAKYLQAYLTVTDYINTRMAEKKPLSADERDTAGRLVDAVHYAAYKDMAGLDGRIQKLVKPDGDVLKEMKGDIAEPLKAIAEEYAALLGAQYFAGKEYQQVLKHAAGNREDYLAATPEETYQAIADAMFKKGDEQVFSDKLVQLEDLLGQFDTSIDRDAIMQEAAITAVRDYAEKERRLEETAILKLIALEHGVIEKDGKYYDSVTGEEVEFVESEEEVRGDIFSGAGKLLSGKNPLERETKKTGEFVRVENADGTPASTLSTEDMAGLDAGTDKVENQTIKERRRIRTETKVREGDDPALAAEMAAEEAALNAELAGLDAESAALENFDESFGVEAESAAEEAGLQQG